MILISVLITLTSQLTFGKVITINTSGGSRHPSTLCCVDGDCVCTSLSTALLNMTSNTVINITSESVTLDDKIKMGSGDLNNITITGNGAIIMCNNSGGVYCESCDNVVIEGITWDKCGDLNTAGVTFNRTTNITLVNSTFQQSQTQAIKLYSISGSLSLTSVNLKLNKNSRGRGGAVFIQNILGDFVMLVSNCEFNDNASPGHGAALYIDDNFNTGDNLTSSVHILNSAFTRNTATISVVYIKSTRASSELWIRSSHFTDNIGTSLHVISNNLVLSGIVNFTNNSADNGAGLYLEKETVIEIADGAVVKFTDNLAEKQGGAIFVDLTIGCHNHGVTFLQLPNMAQVSFINNKAEFGGNSLYFNVPKSCDLCTNISDVDSILHVPCQFKYLETFKFETVYTNVSCETELNDTAGFPVLTSPHQLRLFGDDIVFDNISYFVSNQILGRSVRFGSTVLDYFGKTAEPTLFRAECMDCGSFTLAENRFQVNNSTDLSLKFSGDLITEVINITLQLSSILYYYQPVEVILVIQLVPCLGYPGFVYSSISRKCVCYDHEVVQCFEDYNEIERGYWFGSIDGVPTTSLCRQSLCNFVTRRETREGYFELSDTIDGQCFEHRTGSACGECSPGYALAYDSTDCISVDHCSTGMTVLVIVLTCLYWILVVVGVFSLMYFNFQISSGYVYGIIYYYSMISILLSVNPNISDGAFQFVIILSSFSQLTPRFLGQLCLVEGMSGIDRLFIHYFHAVAVTFLLFAFVCAVKYSPRISLFVSRCILRVICLLLLLSYTSLASTSLQLLRPLIFTDIDKVYTYYAPHIEYFHGRHILYGIVAAIVELLVGIGLPLFLLLEPLLSRKINFIKIKPLLDQFQGCYKDKYRWFAAYYLICRQVIFLLSYTGNMDFHKMQLYLQTALVFIAIIHVWLQPYKNEFINSLDSVILLIMVLFVNVGTFEFLDSFLTEITLTLVIFPLFIFACVGINKLVQRYVLKRKEPSEEYNSVGDVNELKASARFVVALVNVTINCMYVHCRHDDYVMSNSDHDYCTFQESLLNLSTNN